VRGDPSGDLARPGDPRLDVALSAIPPAACREVAVGPSSVRDPRPELAGFRTGARAARQPAWFAPTGPPLTIRSSMAHVRSTARAATRVPDPSSEGPDRSWVTPGPWRGHCPGTPPPRPRRRARAGASARLGCVLVQRPASISASVGRDRRPPGRCLARLEAIEVLGILPSTSFRVRPEGPCEPVAFAVEQRDFPSLYNHGHSLFPRMFPIRLP
jgi:hypothetical protein